MNSRNSQTSEKVHFSKTIVIGDGTEKPWFWEVLGYVIAQDISLQLGHCNFRVALEALSVVLTLSSSIFCRL